MFLSGSLSWRSNIVTMDDRLVSSLSKFSLVPGDLSCPIASSAHLLRRIVRIIFLYSASVGPMVYSSQISESASLTQKGSGVAGVAGVAELIAEGKTSTSSSSSRKISGKLFAMPNRDNQLQNLRTIARGGLECFLTSWSDDLFFVRVSRHVCRKNRVTNLLQVQRFSA